MIIVFSILAIVGMIVALFALSLLRAKKEVDPVALPSVNKKPLLTPTEKSFYARLGKLFSGEYVILTQVAAGAILNASEEEIQNRVANNPKMSTKSARLKIRNTFDRKILDFVFLDPTTLDVAFILELDDKSHDSKKAQDEGRDSLLKSAGYTVKRVDIRSNMSDTELINYIRR